MSGQSSHLSRWKEIKDVFYETRLGRGRRGYSLRKFAELFHGKDGGKVNATMLSFIEQGKRYPSPQVVERLAEIRREDPKELLALLARDQIVNAVDRELKRILDTTDLWPSKRPAQHAPDDDASGIKAATFALIVSRGIALLPDDGGWERVKEWQQELEIDMADLAIPNFPALVEKVQRHLVETRYIEVKGRNIRKRDRHLTPQTPEERRSLAMLYSWVFAKTLLEKLVLSEPHAVMAGMFLYLPETEIQAFQQRVKESVQALVAEEAKKHAGTPKRSKKFVRVQVGSTVE